MSKTISSPKAFAIFFMVSLFLLSECTAQVTFSRNWEAGGKRSVHPTLAIPDIYFKLSSNAVCQYLLSEMKQTGFCGNQGDETSPVFSSN